MLKQMNMAMQYIEENLTTHIDYTEIVKISYCSEYHFKRMFSFLAGISLTEYIRRRKLSVAAAKLKNNEQKIIDIALEMGYSSPDAFTKAFQSMHGVSPSQARKGNVMLKTFPPMTFRMTIQGGNEMNYRIVEKEDFKIVGLKKRIKLIPKGVNSELESMVQSLTDDDYVNLEQLSNVEPKGILFVSTNFGENQEGETQFDQYIGVATSKEESNHWEELSVKASTWAVFTVEYSLFTELQDTWGRIYSEWLPTSGYELTGGPEILWNEDKDDSNYRSEIWTPIIKKDK